MAVKVRLTGDQEKLLRLGRALRKEADGKAIRKDLIKNLKEPIKPAIVEIKAGVMSIPTSGIPVHGESLRRAVTKRIRPEAKLSGRAVGVRVRARKTPAVRNFAHAPKRLNSPKGWRHRVYGRDVWVTQIGKPHYFDDPLIKRRAEFKRAVRRAMKDTARRISTRV